MNTATSAIHRDDTVRVTGESWNWVVESVVPANIHRATPATVHLIRTWKQGRHTRTEQITRPLTAVRLVRRGNAAVDSANDLFRALGLPTI